MCFSKRQGFTLVEVLVVISIVAILASMAIGGYRDTILNNTLSSEKHLLISDIELARSEALKRNLPVTICASADGVRCSTDWASGRIIFVDDGGNTAVSSNVGNGTLNGSGAGAEEILKIIGASDDALSVSFISDFLIFDAEGIADTAGTFVFCDDRGANEAHGVNVNLGGQARNAYDSGSDDIVDDINGNNVAC